MVLFKGVLVRPTEIFFRSFDGSVAPVEVLVVNKSQIVVRFKVLSTARWKYSLSKCKGTLKPGDFLRISFELLQAQTVEANCRDFFKLQFYDCSDGSLLGEQYICSTVWTDPTSSSYQTLDSDSCSSWPSRVHESVPTSSTRAVSLTRAFEPPPRLSARDRTPSFPTSARCSQDDLRTAARHVRSQRNRSSKDSPLPELRALPAPSNFVQPVRKRGRCRLCTAYAQHLFYTVAISLCLLGICLPFVAYDIREVLWWLPLRINLTPAHSSTSSDDRTCLSSTPDYNVGVFTGSCLPSESDEFSKQSRAAISSLKTAFQSICAALAALNPLSMIANFSWFCLGLLMMYRWRT
ncbi:unnamed protein product [Calicophoron daubneyi]|uniref:MSP domain-containing protein n=1 Tax=Calicophoron daubneyi TaxID=300641 RepID=A0AAV2TZS5_CALDB